MKDRRNSFEGGTPFRLHMFEEQQNEHMRQLKALLDAPLINRTNSGYAIDVIELINTLSSENRDKLVKHLLRINR